MAQEEHNPSPRCGNCSGGGGDCAGDGDSGGGKFSKKSKKKAPQRGMGVAQLEKIILEERQMNDVSIRPPSIPLPPPLPPNHHPYILESQVLHPNSVPKALLTNSGSGSNWSRSYKFEGENPNPNPNPNQDPNGYLVSVPPNLGVFPFEPNRSVWPPIPITQRSNFQQPSSSSMMYVSLGTTSSTSASSSVMNYQIEPPSIQSHYGNKYTNLLQEEDKMVGMKRPYPFPVENAPIPSFNCKFPSSYVFPVSRSDEPTIYGNGSTGSLELHSPVSREIPSSIGSIRNQKSGKVIEDCHSLTKVFLTLGPSRSHSSPKKKLRPLSIGEPTTPPSQGQTRDAPGTEWSSQRPLHSFFPVAKTSGDSKGETEEHVDLNLKL